MKPHALWKDYLDLLMEFEGETFECDPADPGGATKFGVDQRSHPDVNIVRLTKAEAERIYLAEFGKSAATHLPAPISFVYFDIAVNAGESQAGKCLQRALGQKQVDGIVGEKTLANAGAMISGGQSGLLLLKLTAQRDLFYMGLTQTRPKMTRFLKGWLRRSKAMHLWAVARLGDKEAA